MGNALEETLIRYSGRFREYAIKYPPRRGGGFQTLNYCPFCGEALPGSLRDEWFDRVGGDIFRDLRSVPKRYRSDRWWREEGL